MGSSGNLGRGRGAFYWHSRGAKRVIAPPVVSSVSAPDIIRKKRIKKVRNYFRLMKSLNHVDTLPIFSMANSKYVHLIHLKLKMDRYWYYVKGAHHLKKFGICPFSIQWRIYYAQNNFYEASITSWIEFFKFPNRRFCNLYDFFFFFLSKLKKLNISAIYEPREI